MLSSSDRPQIADLVFDLIVFPEPFRVRAAVGIIYPELVSSRSVRAIKWPVFVKFPGPMAHTTGLPASKFRTIRGSSSGSSMESSPSCAAPSETTSTTCRLAILRDGDAGGKKTQSDIQHCHHSGKQLHLKNKV